MTEAIKTNELKAKFDIYVTLTSLKKNSLVQEERFDDVEFDIQNGVLFIYRNGIPIVIYSRRRWLDIAVL